MVAKQRDSNIELYRIIIMILIVAHHYVVNSGLFELMRQSPTSFKSLYLFLFGMWGKTGINCFVLITGYFMCQSRITLRKFTKLLFWVLFYNIAVYLAFCLFGYTDFSIGSFITALLPIRIINDDFVSCFLIFFLTIPFLNILIKNMSKQQHLLLLILSLFVYSIWALIPGIVVRFNYVIWFDILYLISSFIRLYGIFDQVDYKKWGWISLCSVLVSMLSVLAVILSGHPGTAYYFMEINTILSVVTSVCLFMFFKNYPLKYHKWINSIGASTFGVLLIHANSNTMRQWLWKDTFNNVGYFGKNIYLHSILSVLLVFFICIMIDQLRLKFIEEPLFKQLDNYMARKKTLFGFNWT